MRIAPHRRGALSRGAGALYLAAALFAAVPALAQDPVVTAADPDMAEQETFDLVVKITGNNFGTDSVVDFYVTGTTDPGGITVKHVKRKNPKTIEATIDVAADAQTQYRFDIQVRSGGRTGKGTELFKVLEKPTGNDTLPPGDVTDLALIEVGFTSVGLTWTAPADDGYGGTPASDYHLNLRTDGPVTLENWSSLGGDWLEPVPGAPGSSESATAIVLLPETHYWLALRTADESGNWSGLSNSLEFTTASFSAVDWAFERVDQCPSGTLPGLGNEDLEYDLDGQAAIFYTEDCYGLATPTLPRLARRTSGVWTSEPLPVHIGFGDDLAFDPISGAATIASSNWANYDRRIAGTLTLYRQEGATWTSETVDTKLPLNTELALAYSGGVPYIAYPVELKGGKRAVRLAEWTGGGWSRHELATASPRGLQLAFDSSGQPALVYREAGDESFRFALWNGASWVQEIVEPAPGEEIYGLYPALVWNPVRGSFTAAHSVISPPIWYYSGLRLCHRSAPGAWSCATAVEDAGEPALAFDSDGVLALSYFYLIHGSPMLTTSLDGGSTWSAAEAVDWDTTNATHLRLDPLTGEPTLSYYASRHPEAELLFARRAVSP